MKNILIFDFGGVLIDWNPHYLYDPYFGDPAKAEWFLQNICTMDWNIQMDGGKPFAQGIAELSAVYPEWSREIELYYSGWPKMVAGPVPGMLELLGELKQQGYRLFGLSNWSRETYPYIEHSYPVLDLLEGKVVSGYEGLFKPQPAIFELLLSRFSLKAEDCIFIDDNAANVAGAEAVGISGMLFRSADDLREKLAQGKL